MLPLIAGLLSSMGTSAGIPAIAKLAGAASTSGIWGDVGSFLGKQVGGGIAGGMKAPSLQSGTPPVLPAVNPQQATPRYLQETQGKQGGQADLMKLIQMIASGGGR